MGGGRSRSVVGQVCSGVSSSPQRLVDVKKEEEQEEAPPPCRTLPQLCSIPRRLVISPGLGGTPVTPQLTEVSLSLRLKGCRSEA